MEALRTTLFLPKTTHKRLKKLALERGTSMAKLILHAVTTVFFKNEQKSAKDLWGSVPNSSVSEKELAELKTLLKTPSLK